MSNIVQLMKCSITDVKYVTFHNNPYARIEFTNPKSRRKYLKSYGLDARSSYIFRALLRSFNININSNKRSSHTEEVLLDWIKKRLLRRRAIIEVTEDIVVNHMVEKVIPKVLYVGPQSKSKYLESLSTLMTPTHEVMVPNTND